MMRKKTVGLLFLLLLAGGLISCVRGTTSVVNTRQPSITQAKSVRMQTATPPAEATATVRKTNAATQITVQPEVSTPTLSMPLFGMEPHRVSDETVLGLMTDSGARLVRYSSILWNKVEALEGVYNWDALADVERDLQLLSAKGFEIIVVVRGTPAWAQKVPGSFCGPVAAEKLDAFAEFLAKLVERTNTPAYHIRYWEIGNEPDVDPSLVSPDNIYGCWGDKDDPYYGGEYYAEMLKKAYPAIKAANPDALLLNGGLLLVCDPTHPPEGKTCLPAKFFEGVLRNGGGDFLDGVSFHGYVPYAGSLGMEWKDPAWEARGGMIAGKIDYLRSLMAQYGVEKPLYQTEISLLCPEWSKKNCLPPGENFYRAQADFVVRSLVKNWQMGVAGTIWYDFEGKGWRYSSMAGRDLQNPKPAYRAFRFLNEKLAQMGLTGTKSLAPGIEAYLFEGNNRQVWVVWSIDETPISVVLPVGVTRITNVFGDVLEITGNTLEISSPVYLDLTP